MTIKLAGYHHFKDGRVCIHTEGTGYIDSVTFAPCERPHLVNTRLGPCPWAGKTDAFEEPPAEREEPKPGIDPWGDSAPMQGHLVAPMEVPLLEVPDPIERRMAELVNEARRWNSHPITYMAVKDLAEQSLRADEAELILYQITPVDVDSDESIVYLDDEGLVVRFVEEGLEGNWDSVKIEVLHLELKWAPESMGEGVEAKQNLGLMSSNPLREGEEGPTS